MIRYVAMKEYLVRAELLRETAVLEKIILRTLV